MSPGRNNSTGQRFYTAYRKLRYLNSRGTLFSSRSKKISKKVEVPDATFRIITLNSLVFFLLGYLIVYLIYLFSTGLSANAFQITVNINYYGIDYFVRGNDWSSDAVKGVFSAGPIIILILSVTLLILYINVSMETGILRLLLIWMFLHGLTRFFGEIMAGAILTRGFGYVILYMFIMDTGKLIITTFAFVALFTIGLFLARIILYSASTYFNALTGANRLRFIWHQYIIPFFLGNFLIFLIKLPEADPFDIAVNASMILILIPIGMRSFSINDLYFDDEPRQIKFLALYSVITIILLALFRIIFGYGIQIG
jgi:hypothetical protein